MSHQQQTLAAIREGNLPLAVAQATLWLDEGNNRPEALRCRRDLLLAAGMAAEATADALELTTHSAARPEDFLTAAALSIAEGKTEEALTLYDRAVTLHPHSAPLLKARGALKYRLGDTAAAAEDLKAALALDPNIADSELEGRHSATRKPHTATAACAGKR